MKPWMDWVRLPEMFDWKTKQADPQLDITVVVVFGQRCAVRVAQSYMWEAQCEAKAWLCEVANVDQGLACLAD